VKHGGCRAPTRIFSLRIIQTEEFSELHLYSDDWRENRLTLV
jgi:hypothetical protein